MRTVSSSSTLSRIQALAKRYHLDFFGISDLDMKHDFEKYKRWLFEQKHADMTYLENHQNIRQEPNLYFAEAKSALVLGFNYNLGDKFYAEPQNPTIAQYARFKDYHRLLRDSCTRLMNDFIAEASQSIQFRISVDTAPLFERAFARKTANGFIGKNTCWIHPKKGSWFLLAVILTDLDLSSHFVEEKVDPEKRDKEIGGCGTCKRCQVHCPTNALSTDYQIDSKKCLSYWTIEHRGLIPREFWQYLGKYYYGCDICQLVCPYNRDAGRSTADEVKTAVDKLDLFDIATMDQVFYEQNFGGTPMTRAKISGLKRNALIAMHVTKHTKILQAVRHALNDSSEVVKNTAQEIFCELEKI